MDKARVFVVEDSPVFQEAIAERLNEFGHHVVAAALTPETAREAIEAAGRGEIEFDVVVLDANLRRGENSGADAKEVLDLLEKNKLTPKVIGISSYTMRFLGIEVDFDLPKERVLDITDIIKNI